MTNEIKKVSGVAVELAFEEVAQIAWKEVSRKKMFF